MRRLKFVVTDKYKGAKVRAVLKNELKLSDSIITDLKKYPEGISLNGERVFVTAIVNTDDVLDVCIKEEGSGSILPTKMPLNILYEDQDILVINKPGNMPTHPSINHYTDTLANGVMYYFKDTPFTFRAITRLDKDTSGVVLIAKNKLSSSILSKAMTEGKIKKEYVALCHGKLNEKEGVIDKPIKRQEGSIMLREVNERGKYAITEYKVLEEYDNYSLVLVRPITGRTHQIRVHLSYIGNPILGDDLYGSDIVGERVRLHCKRLIFSHPITEKNVIVEAESPEDMCCDYI